MDKTVRKYSLEDPQQDLDEKAFWNHQLYEYKVLVLENHGLAWSKMNPQRRENGNIIGFRSILQVVKQVKVR